MIIIPVISNEKNGERNLSIRFLATDASERDRTVAVESLSEAQVGMLRLDPDTLPTLLDWLNIPVYVYLPLAWEDDKLPSELQEFAAILRENEFFEPNDPRAAIVYRLCDAETQEEQVIRTGPSLADTVEAPVAIVAVAPRNLLTFKDIFDFKAALDNGVVDYEDVLPIVCKYEMFFKYDTDRGCDINHTYFTAYYGTMNACRDIVVLLGFDEDCIEHV